MTRSYTNKTNGTTLRFGIFLSRSIATLVVLVMLALPVAPVFGSEIATTETEEISVSEPEKNTDDTVLDDVAETEVVEDIEENDEPAENPDTITSEINQEEAETVDSDMEVAEEETTDTDIADISIEETPESENATNTEETRAINTSNTEVTTSSGQSEPIRQATTTIQDNVVVPNDITDETSTATDPSIQGDAGSGGSVEEGDVSTSTLEENSQDATTTEEMTDSVETTDLVDNGLDNISNVPVVPEEPVLDQVEESVEEASSTPEVVVQQTFVNNDSNRFQFSKQECVSVGNGSYYCNDADAAPMDEFTEGAYAKLDAEGDREIFITVGGSVVQITDNQFDDDAPYYDDRSETVVWHRLIDGRYQIMEYDLAVGSEVQLTSERYNNMEPTRSGEVTVWQGWVGSDWEIMMDNDGSFEMLTDNTVHDISPNINDDHIIWQSFEGDAWKVKVYNTITKSIDTIENSDGGSVQNPRFVLVYDTKFDNGDIETKGYDLESGLVVPLSSTPAPKPESIPDPEPTDEERALITVTQQKPKTEDEIDDDLDDLLLGSSDPELEPVSATSTTPVADNTTATSTNASDIVIPPFELEEEVAKSSSAVEGIPDIVISQDLTEETEEIDARATTTEDIIITPFVEPIETNLDSQEAVATST